MALILPLHTATQTRQPYIVYCILIGHVFDSLCRVARINQPAGLGFMGWVWILLLFKNQHPPYTHAKPCLHAQLDINSSYIPFTQSVCVASTKTPIHPISASQIFALDIRFLYWCIFFSVLWNQFHKLAPNIEEKSVKPVTIAFI